MANTRQITRSHGRDLGETSMMNHDLVRDHIDDLVREGRTLRAERLEAHHRAATSPGVATRRGVVRPARLRLGRWLVAFGWVVAGCPDEAQGTAGNAV